MAMAALWCSVNVIFSVVVVSLSTVFCFRYEAPSDCQWFFINGTTDDVFLHCRLRTINSQFDKTNFTVIPRDYTSVLSIECSDSLLYQSYLESDSFSHLDQLRELHIEYCKFGRLNRGVFHGLRKLKTLTFRSHNEDWPAMTLEIDRETFSSNLVLLERLDLSHNNIFSFAEGIFCNLTSLQSLNVSHNRLQDINDLGLTVAASKKSARVEDEDHSYAGQMKCSTPIANLDASHNNLVMLPERTLNALRHLRELYLNHNELTVVDPNSFELLDQLEKLSLSVNKLVSLPPSLFATTQSLKELNLSNNSLSVLPPALFASLKHLEMLILSWNQLTMTHTTHNEVASQSPFRNLVRLVVLDLSHNKMKRISRYLFSDLYSLQALNLENNRIESIEHGSFESLSNLHTLKLSQNLLQRIDSFHFNGLLVLSHLCLAFNEISFIHDDALKNCSNLQKVDLNNNRLENLPQTLRWLTLLKTLDLSDNYLRSVNGSLLASLRNLQDLRLAGNRINSIERTSFPPLSLLKSLDLSRCGIHRFDRGALDMLTSLETLHLDANNFTTLENVLQNLSNLKWLNVSDNDIRWFDYDLLPMSVEWLDLHRNKIEELGNYRVKANLKLETLDASYNRITSINSRSIPNSARLVYLNDNLISIIEPNTFLEKETLTKVDLYGNQLVSLNLNALRLSPSMVKHNLPEFYLGGNPFQCDCDMEWLQRINALNNAGQYPRAMDLDSIYCRLSYDRGRSVTPLVEASSSDFLCPYKTHCFALCHCCDFDACDCEMTCPANCTCYHDQSWSTNVVDCSSNGLQNAPSRIPMDATDVYLDGNKLPTVGNYAFIGKKNLRVLLLNNSLVEEIYNFTFSGLRRLTTLHLEKNLLRKLHGYEFEPLESLRELYLQHNLLEFIHPRTFVYMKNLQVLSLSHNSLAYYSFNELSANPYLRLLSLHNNPWSCECHFVGEFHQWLQSNAAKIDGSDGTMFCSNGQKFPAIGDSTCSADSVTFSDQDNNFVIVVAAGAAAAVLIFLITLCICCCRTELKSLLYSQCTVRIDQNMGTQPSKDKRFDVLLLYSLKDEAYVRDVLISRIEQNRKVPYKFCLQHQQTGELVDLASSSRKVWITLSKNYLETEWNKGDIRAFFRNMWQTSESKSHITVLVVDSFVNKEAKSDADLRLLLKNSFVFHADHRLFWSKIFTALPEPYLASSSNESTELILDSVTQRHSSLELSNSTQMKNKYKRQLPVVPEII